MKVITSDVKAKIFAQYIGQIFIHRFLTPAVVEPSDLLQVTYTTCSKIQEDHCLFSGIQVVLKSLQNISDEDAIEMARKFGGVDGEIILNRPSDLQNNDIHFSVQVYTEDPKFTSYTTPKYWMDGYGVKPYQWLVSKGYALPYMDYSVEELVELGVYKLK